jgi:hypothetical protein
MTSIEILLAVISAGGVGAWLGASWAMKRVGALMSDLHDVDFEIPDPGAPGHLAALRHTARCGQALWDRLRSVRHPV